MVKTRRSVAEEEHQASSMTAIMLLDFLNDEQVLKKLKQVLFPQALADKIDAINTLLALPLC